MTAQNSHRLAHLATQLAETLMTAVICVDEIRTTLNSDAHHHDITRDFGVSGSNGVLATQRPLVDESTFSVWWQGKSIRLGHTRLFWVLDHLARHPNQFVTHLQLLHEVWDDEELTTATIRSVVRNLRSRLRSGGMEALAEAIQGHNGHYILAL